MKARFEKKRFVISLPLIDVPRLSRSGKSFLVATSRGARKTNCKIEGNPIYVSASAFIRKHRLRPQRMSAKK
jgi:hypothetical protein